MLTFALIGCGNIAVRHIECMNAYGRLVAVCDIVADKADVLAKEYAVPSYYSIDEFLGSRIKADIVAVCTPNGLHSEHSIKILGAGMHVLCEKPMAITVQDCKNMLAASEKSGKNLFVRVLRKRNPK